MQPVGLFFSYAVQIGILTGPVQGSYYFLESLGGVLLFLVLAWFQRLSLGIVFCAHHMAT